MLKHIVMWRFVEGAQGKSRVEHAQWMKEHLEALVGVVPEIRSMEVGVNITPSASSYDAVLISTFDDKEAMEREHRLTSVVDAVNRTFGKSTIKFAMQGSGRIKTSSENQSPHYTTLWSDIPEVTVFRTPSGTRTLDPLIKSQLLYQLS